MISKSVNSDPAAACPLIHNVPIWAVERIARYAMYRTCRTLPRVLLSHLLPKVLGWCVLGWLYKLPLLAVLPILRTKLQLHLIFESACSGMLDSKTSKIHLE